MIDMFGDGADDAGTMDYMTSEGIDMNDFATDAHLGTDAMSMENDAHSFDASTMDPPLNVHETADGVIIGNDNPDDWVHQTTDHTCAVVSQEMVLHDFGMPVSEAQLTSEAWQHGWLTENGTSPQDVGNLLELHGVNVHSGQGIENLAAELAQGHKVIVGVDSGELWGGDGIFEDIFKGEQADHALVVQGVKIDDSGHEFVIVNDPGDPIGAAKEYPAEDFMDAFQDGGCHYVATDNAPPNFEPLGEDTLSAYLSQDSLAGNGMNDISPSLDDNHLSMEYAPENMSENDRSNILLGLDS